MLQGGLAKSHPIRKRALEQSQLNRRWQDRYHAAKTALSGRDDALAAAAEAVEVRLQLLGCTAIEDKLQAGVPETIANLAAAGIRLWVLTGDKQARSMAGCTAGLGMCLCKVHLPDLGKPDSLAPNGVTVCRSCIHRHFIRVAARCMPLLQ